MSRYFFDLVCPNRVELDFRGSEFPSVERAYRQAEIIALDLAVGIADNWFGWTVEVRDQGGQRLFHVPILNCEQVAA